MTDSLGKPVEIHIPRRYEFKGKIHRNKIEKIALCEVSKELKVTSYKSRRITGFIGNLTKNHSLIFLPRKTSAKLKVLDLLLVPDCASLADLHEKSNLGEISWLRPKSRNVKDISMKDTQEMCQHVLESWEGKFKFQQEERNESGVMRSGLRPPQVGALHATLAHWSVSKKPATIVMPTGTGKTETMLALLTYVRIKRLMVVVPNSALRDQIAEKFLTLGILKSAGVLGKDADLPIVARLEHRPKSIQEVDDVFKRANVIVTTMQTAGQCKEDVQERMAKHCSHLFIDEAHHIAARTWQAFKSKFSLRTVIQFTATPFRTDGKKVDGKFIYVYPLAKAQDEGYFRQIRFQPVQGLDETEADIEIIKKVKKQLIADHRQGYDHLVMARARNIDRAIKLHKLYQESLSNFNPVIVHSRMSISERYGAIAKLKNRESHIIVCVDMLGEGFDLPQLKISGLHDRHKSIAITLQFTGRFTRDSTNVGDATVIANIEQSNINDAIRSLYAEDSDWNYLLKVLSEDKTRQQVKRDNLLEGFTEKLEGVPLQTLHPKMSTVVYRTKCMEWRPQNIDEAILPTSIYSGPVINDAERLAIFITRDESYVRWSSVRDVVVNVEWNLYIIHWDRDTNLLYINSSKTKDLHEKLAVVVGGSGTTRISGESVYRVLDGINRLMLTNLGLSSTFGRRIRYTMFAGSDITPQLDDATTATKRKSNLFGLGYDSKGKVSIGCSAKGKIWSMQVTGDFNKWIEWCHLAGSKLLDKSISTDNIIRNLVKSKTITSRPEKPPVAIHWPEILLTEFEERIQIRFGTGNWVQFHECEICLLQNNETGPIQFTVSTKENSAKFEVRLSESGAKYPQTKGPPAEIDYRTNRPLSHLFSEDPPEIHFADGDFLIFNELFILPRGPDRIVFNINKIEAWDWKKTDLNIESQGFEKNPQSIQRSVIEHLLVQDPAFDIIFDDDGTGEIADIVAIRKHEGQLRVELFHCKYARGPVAGNRVADLYEVCGQAQKSVQWMEHPVRLLKRMNKREKDRLDRKQESRFEKGDLKILRSLISRWKELEHRYKVWIVQPGLSKSTIEPKQSDLLAATERYLLETYGAPLHVISSK